MTECYTMSCYDCIHCDRCSDFESGFSAHCADVSKCKHFRNKAHFVEVVMCEDCIYFQSAAVNEKGFLICPASGMEITETDYCSYGEKREE